MSQTASKESFDILVAGAGTAGVCAAIQAARAGASVCLVEKNGIPGGTITAAGIAYPGIFHAWGKQVIAGIGWELVERTRQESRDPLPNLCDTNLNEHWRYQVQIDPVIFAALCDEEFEKAGVTVKYHTMIGAAETAADGIGLTLCGKDGLYPVFARRVIDCTGDANLSKLLGAELRTSDPCQPGTLCVYATGYDPEKLDIDALRTAFEEAAARGEVSCEDTGWSNGFNPHFLFSRGNNSNHISGINAADSAGRTDAEYLWRGSVNNTFYSGAMLTYCISYFLSPALWAVGAPEGVSRNALGVSFELVERATGRTVWRYDYDGEDYIVHWIYARIGKDVSLYADLMRQALNLALSDLAPRLPELQRSR